MDKVEKASLQTIEKNYRKLFADAAGAVMVIVGDVNLETLQPLVEKYVGSLPKGKKATKWQNVQPEIVKGVVSDVFDQKMETPLTTVFQVYSDYRPYSVNDEVLASAVSYILDQVYVETLREDEGGTYGASTASDARREPDGRYLLQIVFNCKPALAEKLRTLAGDGLRKLAEEGPTDEQFTRTVENFKKNIPESRINNSYWLGDIVSWCRFGSDKDKAWEEAVNALTKDAIRDAAARLYKSGNFIEVVMMPGETTEAE
jgi:zinc protease